LNPRAAGALLALAMGAAIAIPSAPSDITIDYPAAGSVYAIVQAIAIAETRHDTPLIERLKSMRAHYQSGR